MINRKQQHASPGEADVAKAVREKAAALHTTSELKALVQRLENMEAQLARQREIPATILTEPFTV